MAKTGRSHVSGRSIWLLLILLALGEQETDHGAFRQTTIQDFSSLRRELEDNCMRPI
jgi:hypothetical protein